MNEMPEYNFNVRLLLELIVKHLKWSNGLLKFTHVINCGLHCECRDYPKFV